MAWLGFIGTQRAILTTSSVRLRATPLSIFIEGSDEQLQARRPDPLHRKPQVTRWDSTNDSKANSHPPRTRNLSLIEEDSEGSLWRGATGACTLLVFHILYIVCVQMLGRDYTSFPLLSFLIVLAPCLLQTREERAGQTYKLLKVTAGN